MSLLAAGILNGYFGIRLRHHNVFLAAFCATLHIMIVVAYCGTFSRASRLQEMQKKLKSELKAACRTLSPRSNTISKESFKAAVNALSCPGLKVGSFHEMERDSALTFVDFLETQLISLLVGF